MGNLLSRVRNEEERVFGRTLSEMERLKNSLTLREIGPSDLSQEIEETDNKFDALDKMFAGKIPKFPGAVVGSGHVAVGKTIERYIPPEQGNPFEPHPMSA